jgi:hypothetical protein
MMLPLPILLLAASAPFAAQTVQGPAKPGTKTEAAPESPQLVHSSDPEFTAIYLRYEAAVHDYDDQRMRKNRKGTAEPDPPHPARRFQSEFLDAARKDSGAAQGWVLENLPLTTDDREERVRLARELVPMLVEKHADEDCTLHAIKGLKAIYDDLDEKDLEGMAQSLVEKSRVDEVKAAALLLEAWNRSRGGTTKDPERLKDTEDIQRSVLYGFPKTRPGKEMSGVFYGPLLQSFFVAERKWVDEIMRLQAAGEPVESWPPQPIHEFPELFNPLAAAGHHSASQFVNKLYPGYEQAARQSLGFGYQWLDTELGTYYSDGVAGPWNGLRADLACVLLRQFPNEKWMYGALKRITGGIEVLPVERVEPGLLSLLEKNKDPRVVPWTLFCLGQCAKMRGDEKGYQRAIDYFAKVRADFPDSDVAMPAEAGRADLVKVMPGSPAPSVEVVDDMGQKWSVGAYKGRVLLLEIWSFEYPAYLESVPSRVALQKELASKPFSIAGVNFDSVSREDFAERTKNSGIAWRTALVNYTDPIMAGWEVRAFPTTVLIDKKGIIRARNLPWPEMTALAKKLVDE